MDLLRNGMTWLAGALKDNASQSVVYTIGSTTLTVSAVIGRMDQGFGPEFGGVSNARDDLDFIVKVADLTAEPRLNATIDYNSRRYTISRPDESTPHFSRDEDGLTYRIHTKFKVAI